MTTLVFFLEERSAQAMLEGLLPRLFGDAANINFKFIVFEGKQDLEKQIEKRLRGWQLPNSVFVVLRDQDIGDCKPIKERLVQKCQNAGHPTALVRIACRELESWYLGDLAAVELGLGISGLRKHSVTKTYRTPDRLQLPYQELRKLTKEQYQRIAGSRAIGPKLSLTDNRSHSFNVFLVGISRLVKVAQASSMGR